MEVIPGLQEAVEGMAEIGLGLDILESWLVAIGASETARILLRTAYMKRISK